MLGTYYLILSGVRSVALLVKEKERRVTRFAGAMLMALTLPLIGMVILSVVQDRGHEFHLVVMIAIAVYSFTKMTFAVINLVKNSQSNSGKIVTLRNISLADGFVSIFALQRSMLVSFEGMSATEIVIMNAVIGSAVCIIVFSLGLNLVRNKKLFFTQV